MRELKIAGFALLVSLSACGGAKEPPAATSAAAAAATTPAAASVAPAAPAAQPAAPPQVIENAFEIPKNVSPGWFVCEALNGNAIYAASQPGEHGATRFIAFDKSKRAITTNVATLRGGEEGGTAAVFTHLTNDSGEVAAVHAFNPEVLGVAADAYTDPVVGVSVGETDAECRWVARTRLFGFTKDRSVLVADGPKKKAVDLYTFDFGAKTDRVAPDDAQRSTTSTLALKNGVAKKTAEGVSYVFAEPDGDGYRLEDGKDKARLITIRGGRETVEELIAFEVGEKPKAEK